jgi:hypothetical protein
MEEVEEHLHLFDDLVVAARLEEGVPVAARPLEVVLTARRIGQDAIEVDDRAAPGLDGAVVPRPVLGCGARNRQSSSAGAIAR